MKHIARRHPGNANPILYCLSAIMILIPVSALPQRGIQVNTDPSTGEDIVGDAANEPTLSIDPTDSSILVCGWRQFDTINSSFRKAGFAYSHDGGLEWVNGGTLDRPPGLPQNTQQTDPVLSVDSQGIFYFWSEVFDPLFGQYVYPSFDGGTTWDVPYPVEDPVTSGDKPWIAIDRTGGIGEGNIYGGWTNFDLDGVCFVRSTDGGATFSPAVRIADLGGSQWMLQYAVGPDGEVYATWRHYGDNAIYVTKSINARDPAVVPTFDAFGPGGVDGLDIRVDDGNDPGFLPINPAGFHQVWIDVDRSNGPRRGWVYALWADARNDACDIYFARSTYGGFTWETGIRVNDDPVGSGAYQWMAAMSVAPNGRIDATWYDTRHDPNSPFPRSELYYSFSLDGGTHWSPNRRISDSFDTTIGYPSQDKIGDYNQIVSDSGGVNIVYAATFNGGQDIYYLRAEPMILKVGPLIAGETATFTVEGATPEERIWLAASLAGEGSTFIPHLDITLNLKDPFTIGDSQIAGPDGSASWDIQVPLHGAGMEVWFQAVQFENGSNPVTSTIRTPS